MNYDNKLIPYHLTRKIDQGSKYEYRDTFMATFWDLGFYELRHPNIKLDSSFITEKIMRLETPTVFVRPPLLQNPDTTSMILPIKDIIKTAKSWRDYIYHCLIAGLLLLVALVLIYFIRKKPSKEEEQITIAAPKEAAHVIAMRKLNAIAEQEDWKKGKIKSYQSDLTYTIREYLENRYNINALESTTDEITRALSKHNFESGHEKDLKEILQIADLVKFAKAQPTEDINEVFLSRAKSFVEDTQEVIIPSENFEQDG